VPCKVKTDDDLELIAEAHGIPSDDLVIFNFNTVNPAENQLAT
jgi:hypothetical protein